MIFLESSVIPRPIGHTVNLFSKIGSIFLHFITEKIPYILCSKHSVIKKKKTAVWLYIKLTMNSGFPHHPLQKSITSKKKCEPIPPFNLIPNDPIINNTPPNNIYHFPPINIHHQQEYHSLYSNWMFYPPSNFIHPNYIPYTYVHSFFYIIFFSLFFGFLYFFIYTLEITDLLLTKKISIVIFQYIFILYYYFFD